MTDNLPRLKMKGGIMWNLQIILLTMLVSTPLIALKAQEPLDDASSYIYNDTIDRIYCRTETSAPTGPMGDSGLEPGQKIGVSFNMEHFHPLPWIEISCCSELNWGKEGCNNKPPKFTFTPENIKTSPFLFWDGSVFQVTPSPKSLENFIRPTLRWTLNNPFMTGGIIGIIMAIIIERIIHKYNEPFNPLLYQRPRFPVNIDQSNLPFAAPAA